VSREPLVPNPLTYGPWLHIPDGGEFFGGDCSVKSFESFCNSLHNQLILGRKSVEVFRSKLLFISENDAVRLKRATVTGYGKRAVMPTGSL
jgi:hypothetical protein